MAKQCKQCGIDFMVLDEDRAFLETVAPVISGKKYEIPEAEICPDCRQQRRLAFCNEWNLYPGKCDMCKKRILSEHPPVSSQPQYCRECWVNGDWDCRDYGRDFDFSRPFFEQYKELMQSVPMMALNRTGVMQNSDYVHYAGFSKNCYLIMHADFCEDCLYGYGFKKNLKCVDGFYNLHNELCYDCIDCHKSYGLKGCQDCQNCSNSSFLRDCTGCKDCFLCTGLRNKQYCFENEQLTKEGYAARVEALDLGSYTCYARMKKRRFELERAHHFKEFQGHNIQNCFGNYLYNCKDCYYSFDCEDNEGARYCTQLVLGSKNNMDVYQYGSGLQQSYNCTIAGDSSYHALFSHQVFINCLNIYYCTHVHTSKNCFGSTCLNHNEYVFMNKQYSESEYEKMVGRVIEHMQETGEWGQYFPPGSSLFGYNKTVAAMHYPLEREEALRLGYSWDDYEEPGPSAISVIEAVDLPDNISEVEDDILDKAIRCEKSGRAFKITEAEFRFYKKVGLPLPRRSWLVRHFDRFALRSKRSFWRRHCEKCRRDLLTVREKDSVYCEDCYLREVV